MPVSSSLFDTFSLHASVTKHGNASLEIDVPRSELRSSFSPCSECELLSLEETLIVIRILCVVFFVITLLYFSIVVVGLVTGDSGNGSLQSFCSYLCFV